jgi:hypothetical protein
MGVGGLGNNKFLQGVSIAKPDKPGKNATPEDKKPVAGEKGNALSHQTRDLMPGKQIADAIKANVLHAANRKNGEHAKGPKAPVAEELPPPPETPAEPSA